MSLFSRRRRQHYEAIAGVRQGVVDYAGATQRHAVGYTERAWEAYQAQIIGAAVSSVAGAVGVDGQEALEFVGLGDITTDEALITQQQAYDVAQDYGLVGPEAQPYIDGYYASNTPFLDQLGAAYREIGSGMVNDSIFGSDADNQFDDIAGFDEFDAFGNLIPGADVPPPELPAGEDDEDDEDPKKKKRRRKWRTPRP